MQPIIEQLSAEYRLKALAFVGMLLVSIGVQFTSGPQLLRVLPVALLFAISVDLMAIHRTQALCKILANRDKQSEPQPSDIERANDYSQIDAPESRRGPSPAATASDPPANGRVISFGAASTM